MITHGVVVVVQRWLLVLTLLCNGGIVSISGNKLDDVYKQLKQLNKPALKSIKSPDGDIIDCVHISHQPAFDHPLLKNHTIQGSEERGGAVGDSTQRKKSGGSGGGGGGGGGSGPCEMRPSYHPEGLFEENKESIPKSNEGISKSITQLWHLNGRCPEGTIPIRRTKKREILRASSIKSFGRKQHGTIPEPTMPTKPEPINLSAHQKDTSKDCLFILYKRESCSSVDSEEFEPEALVDSRVAHSQDNSEVKTGLEEAHRGWFNSGVDSLAVLAQIAYVESCFDQKVLPILGFGQATCRVALVLYHWIFAV
ncbi:hypothetical protein TEA_021567 [Camellia sinensis var. sinensis]|uniref:Neprosin activation peptide domain-containing protein n=1 Tax=Camellia sinensis var. sinensis TaxID=542762 RepID=A0A4S4EUJ0_CAMSN|nr:hypothetical protein TEA_021567 [Camellia sinensis var. sinensis]